MSETIFKNIGSFLQDSCLNKCQTHPDEQISYINISPYEIDNRFMCIECYQSSSYSKEEKNYLISIRKFILKQEQDPHYLILPENVRQDVQKTLQIRGRVNLKEIIQQFCDNLIEMISKELKETQKIADQKTCLIYEKKEIIQQIFNELTNPQKIFDIFDSNRHDINKLNSQIDQYIKVIYVKVNQLQEGTLDYEELFSRFYLDEAEIIKQKILDQLKQVKFYTPIKNSQNNSDINKSIFEENSILIDDSQLSQKNHAFMKLIQQIPNVNQNLLNQIEKKLQNYPIFEDIDFESEEQNVSQKKIHEEQQKNNISQLSLSKQQIQNEQQILNDSLSKLSESQKLDKRKKSQSEQKISNELSKQKPLSQQCISNEYQIDQDNKFSQKQKVKNDKIFPQEKFKKSQHKANLNKQQDQNEEFSEKELSEFLSNALNDEIPFNKFQSEHKNHQKNKSQQQHNAVQLDQISHEPLLRENSSQIVSTFCTTSHQTNLYKQNNRQFYTQILQCSQQFTQNANDENSTYQTIQVVDQLKIDEQNILNKNSEQTPSQQYKSNIQLQNRQSSNIDNLQMVDKAIEQENIINKHQIKSKDISPNNKISKYPNLQVLKNQNQIQKDKNNNNQLTFVNQTPNNEERENGRIASFNQVSRLVMNENDRQQQIQKESELKQQQQGQLQFEGQKFSLKMKKSRLGSNEAINISHYQNNTITIEQPADQYAHYIISKDTLEPQKDYVFLFSIRCAKTDSILIGITPKEYVNEKVLHKMPFYKSFVNTSYESYSQSCERIEKGKSIKCIDDNTLHIAMRVSISNEILQFYDYPKMQNINSIKSPSDLKSVKKFYLTIGLARSKEFLNNNNSCPLRIQILDMRILDSQINSEDVNNKNTGETNNDNK